MGLNFAVYSNTTFVIGIPTLLLQSIDLPNKGYGFGLTLEHDEIDGSVILSVVPGGIAESVCMITLLSSLNIAYTLSTAIIYLHDVWYDYVSLEQNLNHPRTCGCVCYIITVLGIVSTHTGWQAASG